MKQGNNNKNRNRGHNNNNNNRNNNNYRSNRPSVPSKNQVLESSGPSGKIRGNLMQLIEKYLSLGKDAYSQDDIVLAETCYQFADHYTRLFNLANAYDNSRREEAQRNQQQNNNNNNNYENDTAVETAPSDNKENSEIIEIKTENSKQTETKTKEEEIPSIADIPFLNTEIEINDDDETKPEMKRKRIHRVRKKTENNIETASDASA